ncbi:MAG: hypothetical protein ABI444_09105 [Candidatus Kapaibacterium sp.]|jgi:phosphoribosylformimino-5-aminoimidazole carboxamide ribotide isomerase
MLLIIPTIQLDHGECTSKIVPATGHVPRVGSKVYSEDPVDRARLLRKENSKAIHLEFRDCTPWSVAGLDIIRRLREAVDIPFEVKLASLPDDPAELGVVFHAGANRTFLPTHIESALLKEYRERYERKIVPTYDLSFDALLRIPQLANCKVDRIALELSHRDALESENIDWERLTAILEHCKASGIRVTALHGVAGFADLRRLQTFWPTVDSLVLSRALNENRFPCQGLWREVEVEEAEEIDPSKNLWTNPLEGKKHI